MCNCRALEDNFRWHNFLHTIHPFRALATKKLTKFTQLFFFSHRSTIDFGFVLHLREASQRYLDCLSQF